MSREHSSLRHDVFVYSTVFLCLWGLTGLTFGVSFIDLGIWGTPVALVIAIAKTALVVLFFMHLLQSSKATLVVVATAIFFIFVALSLTFADYVGRYA